MNRRWSGSWSVSDSSAEPQVDVLIPSFERQGELAVTLAGLAAQDAPAFRVIISDQTEGAPATEHPAVSAMVRVLRAQGRHVELKRHLPRRGLAEHRHYLLGLSRAPFVLFLDNDVWLEPGTLLRLSQALRSG